MVRFFSRFFYYAKCLCFLLTLKDELHLVSIENTVVKNKREREQQKKFVGNVRTNEQKSRQHILLYCFSFQLSLAFVCAITVVSIHGVNSVIE